MVHKYINVPRFRPKTATALLGKLNERLATLRKLNRLMGGISTYANTHLVIRAFANEPAAVYTRLTEATASATRDFLQGNLTIDEYLNANKAAIKAKSLPLNDVVIEAQRRMLNVIDRCNALGGASSDSKLQGGEIALAERQVKRLASILKLSRDF